MSGFSSINVEHGSGFQASESVLTHPLWLNSTHASATFVKNLNLNMNSVAQDCDQMKQLGWQLHDQDSSAKLSCQSHLGVVIMGKENGHPRLISAQPGSDDMDAMKMGANMKSVLSLGTTETTYLAPKVNYGKSDDAISYPCIDPCYGGLVTAYGSHGIINPQIVSTTPAGRVPLPTQLVDDGPIYVNAKQYHGILRRRQQRAKLAALDKLAKVRKPYLHESRHRHAMRRIRGPGGRFLNTKQLKQQHEQLKMDHWNAKSYGSMDGKLSLTSPQVPGEGGRLWGYNLHQLMHNNGTASGDSSASDITISNPNDPYELPDHLGFARFLEGATTGLGMLYGGSLQQVPVIR